MCWFAEYRDSKEWHHWYRSEAEAKFAGIADDIENIAAEATHILILKLPETELKSKKNPDGLIICMYRRILEDIRRTMFGRPRPPTVMKKLGDPIVQIFSLFCLEKRPNDVIADRLKLTLSKVEEWTQWLAANGKCPEKRTMVPLDATGGDRHNESGQGSSVEVGDDHVDSEVSGVAERSEISAIMEFFFELGETGQKIEDHLSDSLADLLAAVRSELDVTDTDRVLFRLRYVENLSVPKTAEAMKMEAHTVRRHEKRRLAEIREIFSRHGLFSE